MCPAKTKEPLPTHRRKAAVLRNLLQLNRGFEHVLEQFQQLEKVGLQHQRWNASGVNENRSEVNFELVERLGQREEADRFRQHVKKRRAKRCRTLQQ
jgi:hypothetical protein